MINMAELNIYLSGGMSGLSFEEQTAWRRDLKNCINDSYKYGSYQNKPVFFDPTKFYNFERKQHETEREVFEFDLNGVRKSDLVIVSFNDPKSIGTAMELIVAKEHNIPVIGLNVDSKELHPWLTECCTRIFTDMEELVDYIKGFYLVYVPVVF